VHLGSLLTDRGPLPVALQDGELAELEAPLEQLLGDASARERALSASPRRHPLERERLGPPVPNPRKVFCVGRNYADHAAEFGNTTTEKPAIFIRLPTSLTGPYQPIYRPRVSQRMDWEVELAVVIGRAGRYLSPEQALDHVAGYAVFNDISIRDFQHHTSQWTPGKNFDRTGPFGPFIITPDEVPDPFHLDLSCAIVHEDGHEEEVQRSNTSLMVHPIAQVISYLSQWATLEPGDVIATGTPSGVGDARDPQRYLMPGQTLISRVSGIGELKNQVLEEAVVAS
jgi:acylpyruvate hydrolase